jgi:hypothetical protein
LAKYKQRTLSPAELPHATLGPIGRREAPEFDQARFRGVKCQSERPQAFPKFLVKPLGIITILEADHQVVRVPNEVDFPSGLLTPPRMGPRVQDIMQKHVRE